jgi:hypothetical protein
MEHFIWVKPTVTLTVAFREWTSWGRLWHPTLRPLVAAHRLISS